MRKTLLPRLVLTSAGPSVEVCSGKERRGLRRSKDERAVGPEVFASIRPLLPNVKMLVSSYDVTEEDGEERWTCCKSVLRRQYCPRRTRRFPSTGGSGDGASLR